MDDPMIIAAALVLIIGALSTAVVTILKAFGSMKRELLTEVKSVDTKAVEIHNLVNGSKTAAEQKLTAVEDQVKSLNMKIEQLQERRVEDAKTKAAQG